MNAPQIPAGFTAPAPPAPAQMPQPAAPTAPAPQQAAMPVPAAPVVDDSQLLLLIGQKCSYQGTPCTTVEQQSWALSLLRQAIPDPQQLFGYLNGGTNIDLAGLQQAAPQALNPVATQPPPNPVSDQTGTQVAQPAQDETPPAAATPSTPGEEKAPTGELSSDEIAAWDRISGEQCKSVRGLKSRLTKTHKIEWKDYCERFNLDKKTGLPTDAQQTETPPPPGSEIPNRAPPSSPGIPAQAGPSGAVTASMPVAPETPALPTPAVPSPELVQQTIPAVTEQAAPKHLLPTNSYIGSMQQGLDYKTPSLQVIPSVVTWDSGDRIAPEEVEAAYEWITGAFTGVDGVDDGNKPFQIYTWLADLMNRQVVSELPVLSPAKRSVDTAATPPATGMESQAADLITAAMEGSMGPQAQAMVQQAVEPAAQTGSTPATAPTNNSTDTSRASYAQLLGGTVDCIFVTLLDVPEVNLEGRIDANQLAGQAEAESLQVVKDPEDLKFRKDRKVAEQIFAQKLTENPNVYVLVKGYDWVLPENLIPILLRRVCSGGIVKNGSFLEFKF